jgi:fibronectin type 3 domain-containing protein
MSINFNKNQSLLFKKKLRRYLHIRSMRRVGARLRKSKSIDLLYKFRHVDFSQSENESYIRRFTWPDKKTSIEKNLNEFDKIFAEKIKKELGLNSTKQLELKNPWGNLSYSQLIGKAIESNPWKCLTLREIYNWFSKYVPYFKEKENSNSTTGWKVIVFFF